MLDYICLPRQMCARTHVRLDYMHINIYVFMYVCMYICIYLQSMRMCHAKSLNFVSLCNGFYCSSAFVDWLFELFLAFDNRQHTHSHRHTRNCRFAWRRIGKIPWRKFVTYEKRYDIILSRFVLPLSRVDCLQSAK